MRESSPRSSPEQAPSNAPFIALGVLLSLLISDAVQHRSGVDEFPARGWTLLITTSSCFILAIVLTRVRSLLGSVVLTACLTPVLTFAIAALTLLCFQSPRGDLLKVWHDTTLWASGPLAGLFLVRIPVFREDRARLGSLVQGLDTRTVWLTVLGVASATALFVSSLPLDPASPPRSNTPAIALLGFVLSSSFTTWNTLDLLRLGLIGRRLRHMVSSAPDSPATTSIDLGVGDDVFVSKPVGSAYRAAISAERVVGSFAAARGIAVGHLVVSVLVTAGLGVGLHESLPNLLPKQLLENVRALSGYVAEPR
jgi:hypothetical protein